MIFVSHQHDPFLNLALENALLKQITVPSLFLYQNDLCVVMGRAQNPWIETDVEFLQQNKIPLLRRQSGGGTVVHDLGNLNFCFLSPKALFDKMHNITLVQQALADLGVSVEIGEKYDLLFEGKKVSGSAFRETSHNCFHHGTLLLNSNLDFLRRCLTVPVSSKIMSPSVRSRPSSVTNLKLEVTLVKEALMALMPTTPVILDNHPDIQSTIDLYKSDHWIFGRWQMDDPDAQSP